MKTDPRPRSWIKPPHFRVKARDYTEKQVFYPPLLGVLSENGKYSTLRKAAKCIGHCELKT